MRKLLSANISRLLKSKVFWGLEATVALFGAIVYVLVGVNVKTIGENWILEKAGYNFFMVSIYLCVLTAIFSAMFFGTEYADGTIRNKLAVGHSRKTIYISNWLINVLVTLVFLITHYVMAIIVGIPAGGIAVIVAVEQPVLRIVCSLLLALTCASVFTMTTMLESNKARCAVMNILLAAALLVAGFMIFSALEMPEFKSQMVLQQDGSYLLEEGVMNPRYISGGLRTVYTVVEALMPAAFALRITAVSVAWYHLLGSVFETVLFTVAGMCLFQKKDIN